MNQNSKPMTPAEMGRKGGKNRWAKHTEEEKKEIMSNLAKLRWDKYRKENEQSNKQ